MERLPVVQREELWDRFEAGESQPSTGSSPPTIRTHLVSSGWRRSVPVALAHSSVAVVLILLSTLAALSGTASALEWPGGPLIDNRATNAVSAPSRVPDRPRVAGL